MDEAFINKYFVGVQGGSVVVMRPPNRMSRQDALVFAAWIVALADTNNEFGDILKAVQEG